MINTAIKFSSELKRLMKENGMTQTALAGRVGYSAAAVNNWYHGQSEPSATTKRRLAEIFGLNEDYFETPISPVVAAGALSVTDAARLLGKSKAFVERGLQDGVFSWGYAVRLKKWSYWISKKRFEEETGITIEREEKENDVQNERGNENECNS